VLGRQVDAAQDPEPEPEVVLVPAPRDRRIHEAGGEREVASDVRVPDRGRDPVQDRRVARDEDAVERDAVRELRLHALARHPRYLLVDVLSEETEAAKARLEVRAPLRLLA